MPCWSNTSTGGAGLQQVTQSAYLQRFTWQGGSALLPTGPPVVTAVRLPLPRILASGELTTINTVAAKLLELPPAMLYAS